MLARSAARVPEHTPEQVNKQIREKTVGGIACFANSGELGITRRLNNLDSEWDVERVLETNAAAVSLAGIVLAATVSRKWLILPAVVGAFLLQHALQGWCPPLPVLRRLGFRTRSEIDAEKYALKAIRGDFEDVQRMEIRNESDARRLLSMAER